MDTRKPIPRGTEEVTQCLADHITGLQHIGCVVGDLQASIDSFRRLYGLEDSAIRVLPDQGAETQARFAFIRLAGTEFELIEPVSGEQKAMLLAAPSGGGGINHVAWSVRDLDGALEGLAKAGIMPGYVTPGGPVTLPSSRMVYLDPATTGGLLVELIEAHADS